MATKVTILGPEPKEEKKVKPIEFKYMLSSTCKEFKVTVTNPKNYLNIELICKDYGYGFDLMFAYNSNRKEGTFYVGYFNDGVVE